MAVATKRSFPTGPQGPRGGHGRGRGNRNQRTDRDGDVDMSTPTGPRGRVDKPHGRPNSQPNQRRSPPGRSPAGRNPFNSPAVQRETLRRAAESSFQPRQNQRQSRSDDESTRTRPRPSFHSSGPTSHANSTPKQPPRSQNLKQARVTGWRNSTASSDADGGVKSLIAFIERRATKNKEKHADIKGFRAGRPVRIHEYEVQGDVLMIAFEPRDTAGILHINTNKFAGVEISVQDASDAAGACTNNNNNNNVSNTQTPTAVPDSVKDLPQDRIAMVAEVSRLTNLTPEYARLCLEQGDWNWDKAGQLFDQAKNGGTLPADAYINGVNPVQQQQQPPAVPAPLAAPAAVTTPFAPAAALSPEQQRQQQMVQEASQLSGMTLDYAKMCLEAAGWDMEKASSRFMEMRQSLPAEAWI